MVNPANLFRMVTEFIFILLGGFLIWLGLNNRFLNPPNFNPRSPAWLGLGAALIYWGVRSWVKTAHTARTSGGLVARVGGASLVLVGFMMLALVVLELRWVGIVLAAAGAVLALRGFLAATLSLRSD
ncbi:MAG TPA: hypothetical protein VGP19_01660 [Candidatus Acidoferrales bacterium]|jgi:hypothetical protein|nr:hypothetical protein [Candidatus Acidoferrales bacterium]